MSREAALDQSAMRISVASKVKPGACLTLPVHDAVVGVDLPVSVKSTSSMSKTDDCPGAYRRVVMEAEKSSPVWKYVPVQASTVSLPVIWPSLNTTTPVPSLSWVLYQAE